MAAPEFYKSVIKNIDFKPSYWALFQHLVFDAALFCGIYILLNQKNIAAYVVAQCLWPVLLFRCFGLMHDAVHSSAASKLKVNNFVGYVAGAFCFLPYYPWKKAHLQHHYWAGNVEKDPVMKLIRDYNPNKKFKNKFLGFAWKSWIPLLALMQQTVFWILGLSFYKEAKSFSSKFSWAMSYIVPVGIYFGMYKLNMMTFVNFVPGLLMYLLMVEVINFPHHLELPQNHGDKTLHFWEQHQISRSCSYPRWFARTILNNFNLHSEHHIFPKAPWYKLDQIQETVRGALGEQYNHSKNNAWIFKNRQKNIEELLIYKPKDSSQQSKAA